MAADPAEETVWREFEETVEEAVAQATKRALIRLRDLDRLRAG